MSSAVEEFMKHCRRKNLAKATMEYYEEDLTYFQKVMQVQTTGEICKELLENFVDHEMNKICHRAPTEEEIEEAAWNCIYIS